MTTYRYSKDADLPIDLEDIVNADYVGLGILSDAYEHIMSAQHPLSKTDLVRIAKAAAFVMKKASGLIAIAAAMQTEDDAQDHLDPVWMAAEDFSGSTRRMLVDAIQRIEESSR